MRNKLLLQSTEMKVSTVPQKFGSMLFVTNV
jgi:hypothetical protein